MNHLKKLLLKIAEEVETIVLSGQSKSVKNHLLKLESINKAFPNNYDGFFVHGAVLTALNKNKLAIQKYDRAIEINSRDFLSFYSRGVSNEVLGNVSDAISDYESAVKLNPNDSNSYFRAGTLEATKNKNYLISRGYLKEAYSLSPNDSIIKNNLESSIKKVEIAKSLFKLKEYNFN